MAWATPRRGGNDSRPSPGQLVCKNAIHGRFCCEQRARSQAAVLVFKGGMVQIILSPAGSLCWLKGVRRPTFCRSGRFRSRLPSSHNIRRGRGCPCPRASSESKRSLEGEAPRTGSERRPRMADVNVQRVGTGPSDRLAPRKAPTSCRPFLGAEACEAEVRDHPLVLIGGNCFTESADILSTFPWGGSMRSQGPRARYKGS